MLKYFFKFLFFSILLIFNAHALSNEQPNTKCIPGKNIIFYNETDQYLKAVGPEKFKSNKKILSNFSFILQTPGKNYLVEYIFNSDGIVTTKNLKSCEEKKYDWIFKNEKYSLTMYMGNKKEKNLEMYIGLANSPNYPKQVRFHRRGVYETCYNYQNPQCNQFIAETKLVGFRDLKNNKSYAQLKDDYQKKVAEIKKKKEEERLAVQKKREADIKAANERKAVLAKEREEAEKKAEESRQKHIAYKNSPRGILVNSYKDYILIKGFYEARKDYAIQYVNSKQISNAKKQIKAIEKKMAKKGDLNTKNVWGEASKWYKENWATTIELYKSSASYNQKASGIVNMLLISLNSTYNKQVQGGASTPKKDF